MGSELWIKLKLKKYTPGFRKYHGEGGMISNAGRRLCITANLRKGFPDGSVDKESACNARDIGDAVSIPGSERTLREGKWHPTPVFLPEKSHGQGSPVGYSPKGLKETTEQLCIHTAEAFKKQGGSGEGNVNPLLYSWPGEFHGQRSLASYGP